MTERRYSDDEMALIFERATSDPEPGSGAALTNLSGGSSTDRGLTLQDLQEIGAEAGISPEAVARAAAALAPAAGAVMGGGALSAPIQTATAPLSLPGLPSTVAHSVELERPLSDLEWGELVGLLRDTFAARGKVRTDGGFREWSNGNLSVGLEPRAGGERLSMRSRKTNAEAPPIMGAFFLVFAVMFTLLGILGAKDVTRMIPLAGMFSVFGFGAIAAGIANVRNWARLRGEQFQALAERVTAVTQQPPADGDGSPSTEPDRLPGDSLG